MRMSTSYGLAIPTVHLNGTSAADLLSQLKEAFTAVRQATEKVNQSAPHARDYYVQNDRAYALAREQHVQRIKAMEAVAADLERIAIGIQDQVIDK